MAALPMTLTQKILYAHAIRPPRQGLRAGDIVRVKVDWTIASELAWNGMNQTYEALGRPPIHDRDRFYLAIDHTVDPVTLIEDPRARKLTDLSRQFAREANITHFYDANETILHTRFYRGLVQPGELVLGADSHTSSHGGLGAFAIGLGGADITVAMVLGESWIEVPEAIAVDYVGAVPFGLTGKEIILRTLGELGRNTVAMERSVEYGGPAVAAFTPDMRFTIANMTAEFGGLNGIFAADGVVADWLAERPSHNDGARYFRADADAEYVTRHAIDLGKIAPQVAKPFSPDNVFAVTDVAGMPLDGCFIGACTTTEDELVLSGLMLEAMLAAGQAPSVQTRNRLMVPGDLEITARLREAGLLAVYEKAGFRVGPPGCSMCLGVASEKAAPGETWLTSQNRNYQNRMGAGSLAWLASGATVAASALDMRVADPRAWIDRVDRDRYHAILGRGPIAHPPSVQIASAEPIEPPAAHAGAVATGEDKSAGNVRSRVQRFGDHVDTDAIIPGEFCHLVDLEDLGRHCFHHVAPGFADRVAAGAAVIVAGEGWGSGSSREQAVWALKGAGVQVVIARSYAFIHKRNLVNEAVPHLVLRDDRFYALADEGAEVEVDLAAGVVHVGGEAFKAETPSPIVQKLQEAGGIVPAIAAMGREVFDRLTA
ncbi:MAG: 3-isopropylmalate dehydratase [Myxococcales bacterium]|nr:3-isopropylmalate dehydratase [Myxococcales bacterium]